MTLLNKISNKTLNYVAILLLVFTSVSVFAKGAANQSAVITNKTAITKHFDWGTLITYFQGETTTTKDALSAVAIIKPGMEIHPPHSHLEEEYLLILEGSGTWTLHDKDFPANTGDMLFAKPWDLHGLKNTGAIPLKFAVVKWNSKAIEKVTKK